MIESHEWANNRSYVRRTPLGERWYYVYPEGSAESAQQQYTTTSYEQPRKPSPTRSYSSSNNFGNQSDWRQQLITLQDQCSEITRERDALQERLDEMAEAAGRAARHRRASDSGIQERNAPCHLCGQLRQENDNLQGRLSSANQELQDAKSEIARLKKQISSRNAVDVQALTRERNELVNEVDDLHREIETLRTELEKRGSDFSERDRKKIEIEFEKELQAADQEINQLHDEKEKLLVERDQLEEALQQAQNDFDELSAQFNLLSMKEPTHSQPAISLEPQRFNETSAHIRSSSPHKDVNVQAVQPTANITSSADRPSKRGAGNFAPREASSLPWATLASRNQGGGHGVTKGHAAELCRVVGMSTQILENVLDPEDGVVLVQEVGPGSLAERAGIRVQDLIEKWNRKVVLSRSDWNEALETTHLGTVVRVGLLRQGIRKQVILTLPPSN